MPLAPMPNDPTPEVAVLPMKGWVRRKTLDENKHQGSNGYLRTGIDMGMNNLMAIYVENGLTKNLKASSFRAGRRSVRSQKSLRLFDHRFYILHSHFDGFAVQLSFVEAPNV